MASTDAVGLSLRLASALHAFAAVVGVQLAIAPAILGASSPLMRFAPL